MPRPELSIELLIAGIVHRAGERGSRLTKLRIVKFLYLLDTFHAQSEGSTFTGWPWAFVHYGPYCRESTDSIDHATAIGFLCARSFESRFGDLDFQLYGIGEHIGEDAIDDAVSRLPQHVRSNLIHEIDRWGSDTYGLLDFVYFKTGPMANARPGDILSFSDETIPDFQGMKPIKFESMSKSKIKKLKESLTRMKKNASIEKQSASGLYDEHYRKFILETQEEETPCGQTGVAHIDFTDQTND